LGAVIASKKIVDAIATGSGAFLHGFTYNAHAIALAAGRAVLPFVKKLTPSADSDESGTVASELHKSLNKLRDLKTVGDVRGVGLLMGIEFVADKSTKQPFDPKQNFAGRIGQAAAKLGLLVYPMQGSVDGTSGDHLLIAPPAVITPEQIDWSTLQLTKAIEETV